MVNKPGPRGPHGPPDWDIRRTIRELRADLEHKPAWCSVTAGRAALHHLEAMEARWYELLDTGQRVGGLVADYNAIYDEARTLGVEVFQPMGWEDWKWTLGARTGRAPTPEKALIDALASAAG